MTAWRLASVRALKQSATRIHYRRTGRAAHFTFSLETGQPREMLAKPGSVVEDIDHWSTDSITLVKIRLEILCDCWRTPVAA